MSKFVKGMDLSTLLEMERCGAKYYDHGQEMDILDIMKKYDMTEPEAYNYLRRQSMDRKMTMEEFAKESLSLTRPHSSKPVQRKWRTKNV